MFFGVSEKKLHFICFFAKLIVLNMLSYALMDRGKESEIITSMKNVWQESGANYYREILRQEACAWNMLHQPPMQLENWQEQRKRLLLELRNLMGIFPVSCSLDVKEYGSLDCDGYRITKLTYQSRPGFLVTANLYIPDGKGPFPAVLGTHGHWNQGKIASRVAARGHTLAKDGFVCLIVDAFGSGERGTEPGKFEYHGGVIGGSLLLVGETLLGMQVVDNMRGIDLLQSLDYVDGERIGVTGASGGGNQAMWVAAMDSRVKASVPVVSVGTFESYVTRSNCMCELLPNGLPLTEEWGVLALTAPNPMLIINALQDCNPTFYVSEMLRSFNAAREIYRLYDADDCFAYKAVDLPHGYWPEMRSHMLGWFRYWLKNEGSGRSCEIINVPDIPEKDLMCFPDGNRPVELQSIKDFLAKRICELRELHENSEKSISVDDKRKSLYELLLIHKADSMLFTNSVVVGDINGITCKAFTVKCDSNILLPCIWLRPDINMGVTIVVHPAGKSVALKEPVVIDLLAKGGSVCLIDLRGTGETCWETPDMADSADLLRSVLWLGRTVIGDWCTDITAMHDILSASVTDIRLLGFDEAAIAVLATSALKPEFAAVTTVRCPHDYEQTAYTSDFKLKSIIPGIMKWGDVSAIESLSFCSVTTS